MDSTSSLVIVFKESREICARNHRYHLQANLCEDHTYKRNMAENPTINEENLLLDEDLPTLNDSDLLSKVIQSLNANMATMASSMMLMSDSLAETHKTPSATAKLDSQAVESETSDRRKKKHKTEVSDTESSDVEELLGDPIDPNACLSKAVKDGSEVCEDELLRTLALEYSSEDKTSNPVYLSWLTLSTRDGRQNFLTLISLRRQGNMIALRTANNCWFPK